MQSFLSARANAKLQLSARSRVVKKRKGRDGWMICLMREELRVSK